ncbi:MAG: hypothetical protein Q8P84_02990 [Deltaproteobacteria bacterium]|nr:hypothetical protein [Deltaproteobacteria bacterium]
MRTFLAILLLFSLTLWAKEDARPDVACRLEFHLKNRWVPVVAGRGEGNIICDDGVTLPVKLRIYGGWVTLFRKETFEATGRFSKVKDPQKLFGRYGVESGDAGMETGKFFSPTVWKQGIALTFDKIEGQPQIGLSSGSFTIKHPKK